MTARDSAPRSLLPTDLEKRIAEALAGVTEGPWAQAHNLTDVRAGDVVYETRGTTMVAETRDRDDARFIAAARSLLPAALSELRSLREWRDSVSGCIKTAPEFAAVSWDGDKEGWGYHLVVVAEVLRSRRSLRERADERKARRYQGATAIARLKRAVLHDFGGAWVNASDVHEVGQTLASYEKVIEVAREPLRFLIDAVDRLYGEDFWTQFGPQRREEAIRALAALGDSKEGQA